MSTAGSAKAGSQITLSNGSEVLDGAAQVFGLTGSSPKMPKPAPGSPGSPGSDKAVIDLQAAGVRDDAATDLIQFAVAGWQRQTIPLYPARYEIDIDTNRDGKVDFAVFQQEAVGFGSSGQSVVVVLNVATGAARAFFFTDANFDSATQVLSAPLSALGLTSGSTFDFTVLAFDNYFTGIVTDVIADQTWTVGSSKFALQGGAEQAHGAGRELAQGDGQPQRLGGRDDLHRSAVPVRQRGDEGRTAGADQLVALPGGPAASAAGPSAMSATAGS